MDTLHNFCTEYISQGDYRFKCYKPAIHEGLHEAETPDATISWKVDDSQFTETNESTLGDES